MSHPRISVFPKCYFDELVRGERSYVGWIHDAATLGGEGVEHYDEFFPSYAAQMTHIGKERGWPPTTREHFDAGRSARGHLAVGSPQEVIDKILRQHEALGHQRYLMQISVGTLPHAKLMRSIELLGTKVAPAVRKALKNA